MDYKCDKVGTYVSAASHMQVLELNHKKICVKFRVKFPPSLYPFQCHRPQLKERHVPLAYMHLPGMCMVTYCISDHHNI